MKQSNDSRTTQLSYTKLSLVKHFLRGSLHFFILSILASFAVTLLEMELEENTQRNNFTEFELLEGYKQLERLKNPGFWLRIWNAIKAFFRQIFHKE